jgi:PAS domain S-box-containing protein
MAGSVRVLYVDGEPGWRDRTRTRLPREDGRLAVETVATAREGLDRLADSAVDCVVSEYDLPETTGIEFLEAVREDDPDLPFVLFTDAGSETVASDAIATGVTDYLVKGDGGQCARLADRIVAAVGSGSTQQDGEWHRAIIENLGEGVYVIDDEYVLQFVAYRTEELAGEIDWTGQQLSHLAETDVLAGHETEWIRESVDRILEAEADEVRIEIEPRLPAETEVAELRMTPLAVGDGEELVLGTTRDITRRKERERELEWYETLVEETTDILTVVDEAGRIEYESPSIERVLGYEPATLEGEPAYEFVHPDDRGRVREWFEQFAAADSGETDRLQYRFQHADGSWRWLESEGSNRTDTALGGYALASRDVTEQRHREQTLSTLHEVTREFMTAMDQQSVADYAVATAAKVLDQPITAVWLYDEETEALEPAALSAEGEALFDEAPTFDRGEGLAWQIFESGEVGVYDDLQSEPDRYNPETRIESEVLLPLGEYGVMAIGRPSGRPFDDVDVALARILANTVEAALARADREHQLRAQHRELERQNERLEEFASIVSHDLRNPLQVLDGTLELAEETGEGEHFERARRAVDRMERLITDLLTLAREGESSIDIERIPLGDAVENCWHTVETEGATLDVETDLVVRADRSRLKQLFENLFRNAVEHGAADTDGVTVTVGGLSDAGGFYVADDGVGIPEKRREAVFEIGHSTSAEGTGFGLSIVAEIAESHGWEMQLTESAEGGARFEFTGVDIPE